MNKKLTSTDLSELLSAQSALSKKAAITFVREFQNIVLEALEQDKIVKINGLGTFKLIQVAARKSVDVNTGESIEIPAHEKVSFSVDANLKDALNGDSAAVENDPLKKMAEQANELKDILAEMGTPIPTSDECIQELDSTPVQQETHQESTPIIKKEETITERPTVVTTSKEEPKNKVVEREKSYMWLVWVTLVCILLMAAGIIYYLFSEEINTIITGEKTEKVIVVKPTPKVVDEESESADANIVADTTEEESTPTTAENVILNETLATVTTTNGATFAYYARKYYGHPDFWIYIYNANKEVVKNPHNLPIGTTLRIPKLDTNVVNANNPEAISKAIELAKEL